MLNEGLHLPPPLLAIDSEVRTLQVVSQPWPWPALQELCAYCMRKS